jgi:hypothetical protein
VTLPQAAMAFPFPLTHLADTGVVLDMCSAEEVRQKSTPLRRLYPLNWGVTSALRVARRADTDTFLTARHRRIAGGQAGVVLIEDMTNPPDTTSWATGSWLALQEFGSTAEMAAA